MIYSIKNSLPGYLATAGKYSAVNREEQYKNISDFAYYIRVKRSYCIFFFSGHYTSSQYLYEPIFVSDLSFRT